MPTPTASFPSPLTAAQRHRTFEAMQRHGGGFCQKLATAWFAADGGNKLRIEQAFPHLMEDYGPGSPYFGAFH